MNKEALQYLQFNSIKRLVKESIIICSDSQAAVASLGAYGTKLLFVADYIEKSTALSEVNQVPGHSGIQQNETTGRLARKGTRKQIEWRVSAFTDSWRDQLTGMFSS